MERLVLFAKVPRPGHVKTRLAPPLEPSRVLELYRAFLEDQVRFLRCFPACDPELCLDEEWPGAAGLAGDGVRCTLQGRGDLGARMLRCVDRATRERARRVVIIGADAPTLPAARVREAFTALERGADAVVVPALDGGYVLIGMSRPLPPLFRGLAWGGADVLRGTADRARQAGLRLERLAPWYDVDRIEDLRRLGAELERDDEARRRAPATARALAGLPD